MFAGLFFQYHLTDVQKQGYSEYEHKEYHQLTQGFNAPFSLLRAVPSEHVVVWIDHLQRQRNKKRGNVQIHA